ncbi:MAG: enoyl-CoA hydratase-related protein [Bdellovibrionia bacterium]
MPKLETLQFENKNGIGILTISRPQALNALNRQVLLGFDAFVEEMWDDSSLRVLILTGHGEKAFVAGADIKELASLDTQGARSFSELGHNLLRSFEEWRVPVIAAVNGFALGGGCELAMACDFILASENASFGLPEVGLGLIPGFGGTKRLAQFVGMARAAEMMFSGARYTSSQAAEYGLVNRVVPLAQLMPAAIELAGQIAQKAPIAVGAAKRSLRQGYPLALKEALEFEKETFGDLFKTKDHKEGLMAFIEKRTPSFKGE